MRHFFAELILALEFYLMLILKNNFMKEKQVISQVEIYKLRMPLIEPFITSLAYETHVENVIVVIRTESGITGFGESSPYTVSYTHLRAHETGRKIVCRLLLGK